MARAFLKRRWSDFRQGHSVYFAYFLSFINFSILVYEFVLKNVPLTNALFPSMFHFLVVFLVIYIPVTSVVGYLHRRIQMPVDHSLTVKQNPYWRGLFRSLKALEHAMLLIAEDNKEEALSQLREAMKELEMEFA